MTAKKTRSYDGISHSISAPRQGNLAFRGSGKEGFMRYGTDAIRNIAVAGHGSTGKSTFVEHLLFAAMQLERPEAPGKMVSDFTEEEIEYGSSIYTSLSHAFWKDHKINILDTPGSADFVGEVIAAFRSAECAVMLVDSQAGVQIETIKLWRRLDKRNKPRLVFINKMDQVRADFSACLEDVRQKFLNDDRSIVPLSIPIGQAEDYKGIVDLVRMKAYLIPESGARETESEIPESMKEMVQEYRAQVMEAAALGDDELMEKYLSDEDLSDEETSRGLREGLAENRLVPVFCGAAISSSGITALLDFLALAGPSPNGIKETGFDSEQNQLEIQITEEAPLSAFSFKTSIDQYAGKLSYVKVITGVLKPDSEVFNVREGKKERVSKIYTSVGKKLEDVAELAAGDLGVLAKLGNARTNDSLCSPEKEISYRPLALPQPIYSVAVWTEAKKDQDKLSELLTRATEEDKTLSLNFNSETKESVFSGMGELHLKLVFEVIKKTAKIEVNTAPPRIPYRETLSIPVEAEYTHKKQTGGHGQYARVVMKFRPLERGGGFEFSNEIHGGSVSKGYMPGIEKGLLEGMEQGVVAGYPVVDLAASIIDGKEHPVDSSEMAFKLAARGALKEALQKAKCVLLEPVMELHVFVEDNYLGDILSDLSAKRGKVLGQEQLGGGIVEVKAEVPQGELLRYAIDLKSMTSGTGSFEVAFAYYSPISGKVAEEVIKHAQILEATHE